MCLLFVNKQTYMHKEVFKTITVENRILLQTQRVESHTRANCELVFNGDNTKYISKHLHMI